MTSSRCIEIKATDIFEPKESVWDFVKKACAEAMREGIKANAIVINENMVKVPEFGLRLPTGDGIVMPAMICGLNVHFTKGELPDGYSFAVLERPSDRLQQFESIGMEPDELRKAAKLYRRVKEVIE